MECKTARMFLPLLDELGTHEAAKALQAHLSVCKECDASTRAAQREDAHFAKAMNDVPVPAGLKGRILEKLAAGRAGEWREWALQYVRPLTAVAAILFVISLVQMFLHRLPVVELDAVTYAVNYHPIRDRDTANSELGRLGFLPCSPDFVKYRYLAGRPTRGCVPNHEHLQVPVFHFRDTDDPRREAWIYVLERNQFKSRDPVQTGALRGEVYTPDADNGWRYLVLHTGDDWDWLYQADE